MISRALVLLLFVALAAQAQRTPYVIDSRNATIKGVSIKAEPGGKVKLEIEPGSWRTFSASQFKYAYSPPPKSLRDAQTAMRARDWKKALPILEAAFKSHGQLGWAGSIARVRAKCHLELGQTAEAKVAVAEGLRYEKSREKKNQLKIMQAEIEVAGGDLAKAEKTIANLQASLDDPLTATTLLNVRGKLLAAKGLKKDAVLEYLKTALVFKPGNDNHEEALTQIVALLKDLKDNRHTDFQAMLKQQYGN